MTNQQVLFRGSSRSGSMQAGKQLGDFKSFSAAAGAAEMKGPQSRGQRPRTTGSSGGCHSGSIGRDAGGCFAAAQVVERPVGPPRSSELSRPGVSLVAVAVVEETEGTRLQESNGGAAACAAANGDSTLRGTGFPKLKIW